MGGDLTVSSQVGQGSTFRFEIQTEPIVSEELQPTQISQRVLGLVPGQPRYRILVVDDRWENRQLLLKLLEPIGFEVQEAANGQEAIDRWQAWHPHLIWMDMRMPVMNGYEATKQIKGSIQGQATYIIALTASTFEEERSIVLSAGCDDFVRKPFREAVIFQKMEQYLGAEYLYEDSAIAAKASPELSSAPPLRLDAHQLKVMPAPWLEQLAAAASRLDESQVMALLKDVPETQSALAQAIRLKVEQFDYDEIVHWIGSN
jgi:CheY-like chemotaxis protein